MTADNEEALRRYGQEFIEETPELLSSKLKELEAQLEQFPEDEKKWYSLALKKAPDECNRKFKLKHLRCEVFRVKVSQSQQMCQKICKLQLCADVTIFSALDVRFTTLQYKTSAYLQTK